MSGTADVDAILTPRHSALLAACDDAPAAERPTIRQAIVEMIEEDRRLAYSTRQPSVALSASVALGKLYGLFAAAEAEKEKPLRMTWETAEDRRNLARKIAFALHRGLSEEEAVQRAEEGATVIRLDRASQGLL